MNISKLTRKLNKLDGNTYVIEEKIIVVSGVYESILEHDNANLKTLNVYTGSKLTGTKIELYTVSTPSLTPWKTVIKIFSDISPVYISYETQGDTVESDDINNVQDAIIDTQNNLNSESVRATSAENILTTNLNSEVVRAKASEKTISDNLTSESTRAKAAESTLTNNLANETSRASSAENTINNNINSEITRSKAAENTITNTINTNKPNWDDKYSKNEVDNKINQVVSNMDWKESVATFNDLSTTYTTPDDGWTVNVKDSDITYRYSGSAWIPISANSIPLATSSIDGKMSKQDKVDHDDMNSKKHTHSNKNIIDIITQVLVDNWNAAYTHISDAVKHITSTERTNWNTAYNTNHTHSNKTILDAVTQALIDTWNSAYTHASDVVKHITSTERTNWTTAYTNNHTHSNKSVLDGITSILVTNWNSAYSHIGDLIKHITSDERTLWNTVNNKANSTHTHNKIDITNFPANVSSFTNDSGYITATDVDTSQNHTHANKSVLDSITQTLINTWNTVTSKVDKSTGKSLIADTEITRLASVINYTHPTTHSPSIIVQDANNRFATDTEKSTWNGKLNSAANAVSASKLATARTIAIAGDVTGSASFDGNANISITTTLKTGLTWNDLMGV